MKVVHEVAKPHKLTKMCNRVLHFDKVTNTQRITHHYGSVFTDSSGQSYGVTARGNFVRIDASGHAIPRVRQSKKQKLKARRAIKIFDELIS